MRTLRLSPKVLGLAYVYQHRPNSVALYLDYINRPRSVYLSAYTMCFSIEPKTITNLGTCQKVNFTADAKGVDSGKIEDGTVEWEGSSLIEVCRSEEERVELVERFEAIVFGNKQSVARGIKGGVDFFDTLLRSCWLLYS